MIKPPAGWQRLFPWLEWRSDYGRITLGQDLVAAGIVTVMLIPQSLAYAMLAGLPPQIGLYASILPLVAYAIFGSSRTLAVGPVAVISLMTAAAAQSVASPGSAEYIAAALALAWLSGLVLLAMAVLRLGFIANFLSHPVISGFISASGLLIACSQIKHLLGVPSDGATLPEILYQLTKNLLATNPYTLIIGVACVVLLQGCRSYLKKPLLRMGLRPLLADLVVKSSPLLAVFLSIAAVRAFDLTAKGVKVVGVIPEGLPALMLPAFSTDLWVQLLPSAALISLVGFVESVSVAQTLAAKRRQRVDANQELVGLGTANIAAAISGGYPVTGGFARSVVNFEAGAATPLAGAFTAAGIAFTALYLTPLFHDLPQAVLAATIIVAVLSLVEPKAFLRTYRYSKGDFIAMLVTALGVLLVGVEHGIVAGVALSLGIFLYRTVQPHVAVIGVVPGSEHFRNVLRHSVITSPTVLGLRVDESLYFANARHLEDWIYAAVAKQPTLRHVVLACPAVNLIDASAVESLEAIASRLHDAGITLHLSEVKGPVMDRLKRSEFFQHFRGRIFLSQFEALHTLDPQTAARAHLSNAARPVE